MRSVLFCNWPYAIGMLSPIADELSKRNLEYIWYIPTSIDVQLLAENEKFTQSVKDLHEYNPCAIFVPGNQVPWYLSGVKTQIFHGMAAEKKGHFRIRDYFDLYLTQGPYFTKRFESLAAKYKNFSVTQTGWAKLDALFLKIDKNVELDNIFPKRLSDKILLYAPTFSPSLCSAKNLKKSLKDLSETSDLNVLVKFHDKMDSDIIAEYQKLESVNFKISNEKNITKLMQLSDAMLSDTSSVVYEFLLLGKPVFTYKSKAEKTYWYNSNKPKKLFNCIKSSFETNFSNFTPQDFINSYHPYQDGLSAKRNVDAVLEYIEKEGVPLQRKLPLHRKVKLYKSFKYVPSFKSWF